jgi:hypothetical protein
MMGSTGGCDLFDVVHQAVVDVPEHRFSDTHVCIVY